MRLNISLSEDVVSRADSYCRKSGISRSMLISKSIESYLDSIEELPQLVSALDSLKDLIDDSVREYLQSKSEVTS